MLTPFPLLVIPLAIYNIFVFLMPGFDWSATLFSVAMLSGATWSVSMSDAFLAFTLFVLTIEIIKATRVSRRSIVDHMLSMLVFVGALVEFLLVPQVVSSTFALLLAAMLLDVVAGFSISVRVAQRDFTMEPRGE